MSNNRTSIVLRILITCLIATNVLTLGALLWQHSRIVRQQSQIEELSAANEALAFPRKESLPPAAADRLPNDRLIPPIHSGAFANVKESDIPGRYRWFESEKDRGIISLNADHTFTLANGQQLESYRWALSPDHLVMEFNRQTSYYTNVAAPGVYLGVRTDRKSLRLEKVE